MYTEQLTGHHEKIWQLVKPLQQYKEAQAVKAQAREISLLVSKLSGILSIHLAAEDKYLYPALLKDGDRKVRTTAEQFSREMGQLASVYAAYKDKFMTASQIEADPAGFLQQNQKVLSALANRLEREDRELYPLLK